MFRRLHGFRGCANRPPPTLDRFDGGWVGLRFRRQDDFGPGKEFAVRHRWATALGAGDGMAGHIMRRQPLPLLAHGLDDGGLDAADIKEDAPVVGKVAHPGRHPVRRRGQQNRIDVRRHLLRHPVDQAQRQGRLSQFRVPVQADDFAKESRAAGGLGEGAADQPGADDG